MRSLSRRQLDLKICGVTPNESPISPGISSQHRPGLLVLSYKSLDIKEHFTLHTTHRRHWEDDRFMHPFSILTLGIFVAGYITARWDLVTRLYELAIFAVDHGVVVSRGGYERVECFADHMLRLALPKDSHSSRSDSRSLSFLLHT